MSSEAVFPIFIGVWVILGLLSFLVFFVSKNVERKKRFWTPFIIFTGVLFIAFIYLMGFGGQNLYIMIPMVVLISFLNIRSTKFCDSCGKTNINQQFLSPAKFCNKCGEALE
ncbi:hypothetical protein H4J58_13635 [Colwellia sp. MB3u-70]|uniref:hypothetical protein n=1 Tax=unclassified Colwellia TaxID=196834 RepID=UPI0015F67AD3|nr:MULTISPECIES: hypothetical protein [unclassified Colwellia]MBA6292763.1 hypothetical protein [Colwellia sp. MB3u-8]MBA6308153.1 hypothetical protein [Colwellia sp. MB3u-70]